jgi:hypothetical protein
MYMPLNPPEGVGFGGHRASMHGCDAIDGILTVIV